MSSEFKYKQVLETLLISLNFTKKFFVLTGGINKKTKKPDD
jgi:hypothetical protein